MALDSKLLDILACPRCKGAVQPTADGTGLVCRPCRLRYAVVDDIPIMLVDDAVDAGEVGP